MPVDYPKISLKAARVNAGLGQREAAKMLEISLSTLQNYESGTTAPDVRLLEKIERVYSFPVQHIFFASNHANSV